MDAIKQEGMEVLTLASQDNASIFLNEQGYNFQPLRYLNYQRINPSDDIKLILELYNIYRKYKPVAILHYHIKPNIYGSIAAKLAKSKSIITITGTGSMFSNNITYNISNILYKIAFLCSDKVFFQNKDDRDLFIRSKFINKNKTVLVSGSGIDTNHFTPDICNRLDDSNNKEITFLLISRMIWEKGIAEFVESARAIRKIYPMTKFYLLGQIVKGYNSIPAEIIKEWESEGVIKYLSVVFDVRPIICKSDIVVLPSYYNEGIPRSLLEGMAMEKPIITTDSVGCRDLIEDNKNGFMIPPKDISALTNAMKKIIEIGPQRRKEMGIFGRNKAKNEFNERNVINEYIKTIREIKN